MAFVISCVIIPKILEHTCVIIPKSNPLQNSLEFCLGLF